MEDSGYRSFVASSTKNHRRALDLIFEHRDRIAEVGRVIQNYISSRSDDIFSINDSTTYIKFLPECMNVPQIQDAGIPILAWAARTSEKARTNIRNGKKIASDIRSPAIHIV